jgi:hypothetical protein
MLRSWSLRGMIAARTNLCIACALVAALAAGSCKSDKDETPPGKVSTDAAAGLLPDAAGSGDAAVASPDAMVTADAMAAPLTCADNETCAFLCEDDAACKERCSSTLAGQEKALLDAVVACRQKECPDKDDNLCRCEAECYEDGPCATALDACTGGLADPWCDKFCH